MLCLKLLYDVCFHPRSNRFLDFLDDLLAFLCLKLAIDIILKSGQDINAERSFSRKFFS